MPLNYTCKGKGHTIFFSARFYCSWTHQKENMEKKKTDFFTDNYDPALIIEGRRRRGWQRIRWLDGITDSMDEQASGDGEGQKSLVCYSSRGCKESDTTEQQNNSNNGLSVQLWGKLIFSVYHLLVSSFLWKLVICPFIYKQL